MVRGLHCALLACSALVASMPPVAGFCSFTGVMPSSRSWTEPKDSQHHFQLILRRPEPWRSFSHVVLEWTQPIQITSVMGMKLIRSAEDAAFVAEFELDGFQPRTGHIELMGTGTLDVNPDVVCRESSPPAPDNPHLEYCSLGPSYKVVRMWEEAAIVQVSLEYWTDAKVFTITYFGEHLMINKPKETVVNGELISEDFNEGNTIFQIRLVPKDFLHGGKLIFSLQIAPPPHLQPRIECHLPWHPPPPEPPPRSPPKPRAPPDPPLPPCLSPHPPALPPPHLEITADRTCPDGGTLKIASLRRSEEQDVARVVVSLSSTNANFNIVAVLSHEWNSELVVSDLARAALVSQELEPTADATELELKPFMKAGDSTPFFGFNVRGKNIGIQRLWCREQHFHPPAPPFVVSERSTSRRPEHSLHVVSVKSAGPTDEPNMGWVAAFILAAAFAFMFKDVISNLLDRIGTQFKRFIPLPGYGSVGSVDPDISASGFPVESGLELGCATLPMESCARTNHARKKQSKTKTKVDRSKRVDVPR